MSLQILGVALVIASAICSASIETKSKALDASLHWTLGFLAGTGFGLLTLGGN